MPRRLRICSILAFAFLVACGSSESDDTERDAGADLGGDDPAVEFQNLRVEEIGARRAVVRFETSVETTCVVDWGLGEDALDNRSTDPNMEEGELSLTHEVPLEDLQPETTYYWRGFVVDEDGAEYRSDIQSFQTDVDDSNPNLMNFSLGATVTDVSSNFGGGDNDSTWGANNAFDGKMATEWASNGDGDEAMIAVEFDRVRKVTHFAFRSREMTDGSSIIESVELDFEDGDTLGPFQTPDPDQRYSFQLDPPQAAQAVTIRAVETTGGNTGIREAEFLGTPKE